MRKKLTDSKNKVMFYYFDCRFFKGLIILYQYVAMVEIGIISTPDDDHENYPGLGYKGFRSNAGHCRLIFGS